MIVALALIISGAVSAQPAAPRDFPVPRAKREFAGLVPHVRGYCGAIGGDEERFRRAVLPFGPMALTVGNGTDSERRILRELYLGMVGAACRVDAAAMAASFVCATCTRSRRSELVGRLPQLSSLVTEFAGLNDIQVLSQWGAKDEFRANNTYVMFEQAKEAMPSASMAFVPSEKWVSVNQRTHRVSGRPLSDPRLLSVVRGMRALSVAAIVREKAGLRLIRVGIGNRESGLLFVHLGGGGPRLGEVFDGRKYSALEEVDRGVLFYETE
jgi:hypothetical protein